MDIDSDSLERFRDLYETYARRVAAYFRQRGVSYEVSIELTQEVFLRVYRGLPEFRGEAEAGTWIQRIVINVWMNHLRSSSTQKRAGEEVQVDDLEAAERIAFERRESQRLGNQRGTLETLLLKERYRRLRNAVRRLPALEQRLLRYQIDHEMTLEKISSLEDIPAGTVKSRLFTARKRLRQILGEDYPEIREDVLQ